MRIIVGARGTQQPGWISLERGQLDIRDYNSWASLFQPGSVAAVLSEHVLEHLDADEARAAAANVYEFLASGGYWRIAVPDAGNPSPRYQEWCRPNGPGQAWLQRWNSPGEPGHKIHYDVNSLGTLLSSAGFNVVPLEFYSSGVFYKAPWDRDAGDVRRSDNSSDLLQLLDYLVLDFWHTSLIVDAVK
jgi:predicted SAM-dependent methyltransferase